MSVGTPPPRRVRLVNQYYWPDVAATAQLLTDLGEHLARRGMQVQAIASQARYSEPEGGPQPRPRRAQRGGVAIHRVRGLNLGRRRLLGRIADYACPYVTR